MDTTPLSHIMTRQVQYIGIDADALEARDLMDKYAINHLPVLDNGNLAGIISKNDINKVEFLAGFLSDKNSQPAVFRSLSVQELMTEDVTSLPTDATIAEAIQIFGNYSFQCIPLIEKGDLVGMVTTKDIFHHMLVDA